MAQKLTVIFSGIIAFTKHTGGDKYAVAFPPTVDPKNKKALDGQQELREHFPHLVVDRDVIFLGEGQRLDFAFSGEPAGGTGNVDDTQLLDLLQMTWALPAAHGAIRQDVLTSPSSAMATTVLELDCGELSTVLERDEWEVDGSILDGPHDTRPVASEVHWTVKGLRGNVEIGSTPFGGTREALVTLPTGVRDVTVRLQNFMGKDVYAQFQEGRQHADTDHDFCWYFELLDDTSRGWVKHRLASRSGATLPIPRRREKGITQNCMPGQFPDSHW
jgi:hypothetical protein